MEKTAVAKSELSTVLETLQIDEAKKKAFIEIFEPFVQQAMQWAEKAKGLTVTSADQKDKIQESAEMAKALAKIRIENEKKRKVIKEASLREGQAIDKIAAFVENIISPIEKACKDNATFVERVERERKEKLETFRKGEVLALGGQPEFYDLGGMTDEAYNDLINMITIKKQRDEEDEKAAAALAEENRKIAAKRDGRLKELSKLGMVWSDDEKCEGYGCQVLDIHLANSDEDWADIIARINSAKARSNRVQARMDTISSLDMTSTEDGNSYHYIGANLSISYLEVENDEDTVFNSKIELIANERAGIKAAEQKERDRIAQEREDKEKQERENARKIAEQLFASRQDILLSIEGTRKTQDGFILSYGEVTYQCPDAYLEASAEDWKITYENFIRASRDIEKLKHQESVEAELAMGDADKMRMFAYELGELCGRFSFKSKKCTTIYNKAKADIQAIIETINAKVK